jgi:hypothetical protein
MGIVAFTYRAVGDLGATPETALRLRVDRQPVHGEGTWIATLDDGVPSDTKSSAAP